MDDAGQFVWLPTAELSFELRWEVVAPGKSKPCRYSAGLRKGCGRPSVARLDRARGDNKSHPNWWHYCSDHLYGRRIRDGRLETLLHIDSPQVRQRLDRGADRG